MKQQTFGELRRRIEVFQLHTMLATDVDDSQRMYLRAKGRNDEELLQTAVTEHLAVLSSEQETLRLAHDLEDEERLFRVASATALMRQVAPWSPREATVLARSYPLEEPERVGPDLTDPYRSWLNERAEHWLPAAAMTVAGAWAVRWALDPRQPLE